MQVWINYHHHHRLFKFFELREFELDLEKIDFSMELVSEDSIEIIIRDKWKILLARLTLWISISWFDGLASSYVMFIDAINNSNIHRILNFTLQYDT